MLRTLKKIYENFTSTTYLGNSKKPNKPKPKRSDDNIKRVRRSIEENPTTLSRHRSANLNIAHTTLRRIIHYDLGAYLYGILSKQILLPADHERRLAYSNFVIEQATADDAFWHSIMMTDEAYFSYSGAVSSQNYRDHAEKSP